MKVFVAGGTGAIGSHAVPALVRAGHTVTALARTPDKAAALAAQGAEPRRISIFDTEALAKAFAGHDAVINLASRLPSMARFLSAKAWAANNEVRTKGSAALVDAAMAAGVGRYLQESVSMLYRDRGADWVDEDWPVDNYPSTRGNHAAEANARRFAGAAVVLRFGWFYGPGAAHSEQLLAMARRHVAPMLGPAGTYVSSIQMADAGEAAAAALDAPAGTYNIVDDEPLTKRDYADALARAAGTTPWIRGPGRAALLLGDRLTSLTRSLRVSNARFKNATGWVPRYPSAREGWQATALTV
ncbi:MAG TPA: NAD(P)-dependent oxidoreductase [Amycolatopsis sp.]|nr:NAD(P)-dependent oxidoreductase [Amycolatopsis sp.]